MEEHLHDLISLLSENWVEIKGTLKEDEWAAFLGELGGVQAAVDDAKTEIDIDESYTDLEGIFLRYDAVAALLDLKVRHRPIEPPRNRTPAPSMVKTRQRLIDVLSAITSKSNAPEDANRRPGDHPNSDDPERSK
jgi:hypothetical protein